jgi:hypothetical protein
MLTEQLNLSNSALNKALKVGALCLALFSGCRQDQHDHHVEYSAPPGKLLREYPSYAVGHHFEVLGTPKFLGQFSWSESYTDGFSNYTIPYTRYLYEIDDIKVQSNTILAESCRGVRGTWQQIERADIAKQIMQNSPEFVLRVENVLLTKTEWQ